MLLGGGRAGLVAGEARIHVTGRVGRGTCVRVVANGAGEARLALLVAGRLHQADRLVADHLGIVDADDGRVESIGVAVAVAAAAHLLVGGRVGTASEDRQVARAAIRPPRRAPRPTRDSARRSRWGSTTPRRSGPDPARRSTTCGTRNT